MPSILQLQKQTNGTRKQTGSKNHSLSFSTLMIRFPPILCMVSPNCPSFSSFCASSFPPMDFPDIMMFCWPLPSKLASPKASKKKGRKEERRERGWDPRERSAFQSASPAGPAIPRRVGGYLVQRRRAPARSCRRVGRGSLRRGSAGSRFLRR